MFLEAMFLLNSKAKELKWLFEKGKKMGYKEGLKDGKELMSKKVRREWNNYL